METVLGKRAPSRRPAR